MRNPVAEGRRRESCGHSLYWFLLLVALCRAASGASVVTEIEKQVGKLAAQGIEEAYGTVDSPLLTHWVTTLGSRLSKLAPRQDVYYRFAVINTDEVNALAAPGGYIFVTRGLLRSVKSDDELASVVGHEIGHVTERHAVKQFERQGIFFLLASRVKDPKFNNALYAARIANFLLALQYSRDQELESDRWGLRLASEGGYDPRAMLDFFQELRSHQSREPSKWDIYFETHPAIRDRLRKASADPLLDPNNADAQLRLAQGQKARFHWQQSRRTYERLLDKQTQNAEIRSALSTLPAEVKAPAPLMAKPSDDRSDVTAQCAPLLERASAQARSQLARLNKELDTTRKTFGTDRLMERFATIRIDPNDYRFLALYYQAEFLIRKASDSYMKVWRLSQQALPSVEAFSKLLAGSPHWASIPLDATHHVRFGTDEIGVALLEGTRASKELKATVDSIGAVLLELSNPFRDFHHHVPVSQFTMAEALVQRAESDVKKAVKSARRASQLLAQAQVRRIVMEMSLLQNGLLAPGVAQCDSLAVARLKTSQENLLSLRHKGIALGEQYLVAALQTETGKPLVELEGFMPGQRDWVSAAAEAQVDMEALRIVLGQLLSEMKEEMGAT